jgi:hypothetical protein
MFADLLLAFGFGNLAMLGWLAAAAAPLLIHLWSRHRHREAPWAAMQFLLAAMRKNARRLQLQQWLLLAVRTLIIALVVMAVAEPYGEKLLAGLSGTPTHKILIIDGSYSMDYRDADASRFVRAKRTAAALVRDSRSADTFTVILMAAPSKTILGREVVDHAAVIDQIEALTQPHTGADLTSALALAEEAIQSDVAKRRSSDRHEVYFLTDLQRLTWQSGSHALHPLPSRSRGDEAGPSTQSVGESRSHAERGNEEKLRERVESLARHAALAVIDLGQLPSPNLAVTNLATADPVVTINREITFDVTLRQFGSEPRSQCAVALLVDGVSVSEQTVDVPTGADATVRFMHRFQSPGEHTVEVRAPGDRLEIDNSRWLVVPVREEIRVLCIAGRPGAAKYVADALNPNPGGDSPIHPVVVSEGDLADVELSGFDCVFVCNVAQLTSSEAERLSRYAAAGGGVVFFLGDRVDRDSYNAQASGKDSLLPATLGDVVSQSQFGLDPLDYRHPIVAPFRGRERAGLLTTPVARYHRLDLEQAQPNAQVAAAMPNGDPFIVTAPLGRGQTVLIATDGSLSSVDATTGEPWTNWPTWPSFLPLVRELLAYATSGQQQDWQHPVGTPLASRGVPAPELAAHTHLPPNTLKIERPDKKTAPVSIQSSPTGTEWSYNDTTLSGLYTLRGLPDNESRRFAVNVDTKESDLSQADAEILPPELLTLEGLQDAANNSNSATVSHAGWNESMLWAALMLLFVESFLAWQFGRGAL